MKKLNYSGFATAALLILLALSISNCSAGISIGPPRATTKAKPLPPGQAKKVFGGKSARNYAPGHNKNS
jgi:hypothetical protein